MKVLIDTNILLYAIDNSDQFKHQKARDIIRAAFESGAVISVQNIGEAFHKAKIKFNDDQKEAVKTLLSAILKSIAWKKISYNEKIVWNAIENNLKNKDFWDLILYYTMLDYGVTKIITENEKDFEDLEGIEVINPFKTIK